MTVRTGNGRGDLTKGQKVVPWEEAVNIFITASGVLGVSQTELLKRFKSAVDTEMLNEYVDTLWMEGKVDRYQRPHHSGKGKSAIVWRATTKMVS